MRDDNRMRTTNCLFALKDANGEVMNNMDEAFVRVVEGSHDNHTSEDS